MRPTGEIEIRTSNRLEHLLEAWAERLREAPLPPFGREVVVVQSQGMRRWLTLELARRQGIAAGLWMPFPRELARGLAEAVLDGRLLYERGGLELDPWGREVLLWRLFDLLGAAAAEPGGPLRAPAAYLAGDADGRKRYQLASRLAALFDDYQLFRGDWLETFEAGSPLFDDPDPRHETAEWQALLWRRLTRPGAPGEPLARRLGRTLEALRQGESESFPALPARLTVFGVSSLPPIFLTLLQATARHLPVELYFASPTWHFWGDLTSDREQSRLARRRPGGASPGGGHYERGNSLLAALGGQGRDFFNLLQELDESGESWHDAGFAEPGHDTLLHTLQADLLDLVDRGAAARPAEETAPPLPLDPADLSLRIHLCHSPLREMEVLREELLHALVELPGLVPSDVLVLLPEIESYAPLIDAVFGVAHDGAPALPYAVADRRLASTQKPAAALLYLLELVGKRLTVAEVFGLLDNAAARRAAGIEESELALLRSRIAEVGVRWAIDGRQRAEEFGLPLFEEASWQAGADRLLLGYAIGPGEGTCLGIAPAAGDGAGDTDLLGRFLAFLDRLFADLEQLKASRPAARWAEGLIALVGRQLTAGDEDEELALQLLRDGFARFGEAQALAGDSPEVLPLEVIRQFLKAMLGDEQKSGGFLAGGITFCALRPMRSIPFRVVAVAGLEDSVFPRRDPPRAFDLLAAAPRPGDRSPRADDRYLFLETLLAARDRLLLLYPGASQRDAAEKAPSVVVAELLDLADRSLRTPDGRPAREHLVVRHPLQAWSPGLFAGARRSYSRENAAAAAALLAPRQELPPFLPAGFTAPPVAAEAEPAGRLELQLSELIQAFASPSRYFCTEILGLALAGAETEEGETEPFAIDALPRFRLLEEMLARRLDGEEPDPAAELALLRARFDLPPGLLGEAHFRGLLLEARGLLGRLPAAWRGAASRVPVELAGHGWQLRGGLLLRGGALVTLRPARLRPRDLLAAHLSSLALQAAGETALRTAVCGREGGFELRPAARPGRALQLLEDLVAGFRELRERPIPFFENASFAFAEEEQRLLDPRRRRAQGAELEAARRAFEGDPRFRRRGDRDAATNLLWRGRDPLAEPAFAAWASRVFRPLLEARRELRW